MSNFAFLPLSTDAYLADTRHLTVQEHGAYLLLLMTAWRMPDCRLPDDDEMLARWASVDRRTWLRMRERIMGFWTLDDGRWSQKRLLKEREYVSKRAEVSRENGKQGGRPKSLKDNDAQNPAGSLEGTQPESTLTLTSLNTPIPPKGGNRSRSKIKRYGDEADPLYADFLANVWNKRWKRTGNNPLKAFRAYSRLTTADRTLCKANLERCGKVIVANSSEERFRPMLATWINANGWGAVDDGGAADTFSVAGSEWAKRVAHFRCENEWPTGWGPRPGDPGCKVPPELLLGSVA
jgi:uncharacterized protein YdaU (DUF1376 family)